MYVCLKCGETTYGLVSGYVPNIWLYQKSRHGRMKYFRRCIEGVVGYQQGGVIAGDFEKVVRVMIDHGLNKGKNMSKYGYYIIRLASRRSISLINTPQDLKPGKTKRVFDDRLFGEIYSLLGWEPFNCLYYLEWIVSKVALSRAVDRSAALRVRGMTLSIPTSSECACKTLSDEQGIEEVKRNLLNHLKKEIYTYSI